MCDFLVDVAIVGLDDWRPFGDAFGSHPYQALTPKVGFRKRLVRRCLVERVIGSMNTSVRLLVAIFSSLSLFACAGSSSATQRGALDPRDDSMWRPADAAELSFSGSAARATNKERLLPSKLRPNQHEAKRGALHAAR